MKNEYGVLSPELKEYRIRLIENLRKNPVIRKFLADNHKDESFLDLHASLMADYLNTLETCRHCQGRQFCPFPTRGLYQGIQIDEDGWLNSVLIPCRYEREEQKKRSFRKKIWHSDMDADCSQLKMTDFKLTGEPQQYIQAYLQISGSKNTDFGAYLYGQAGTGKSYLLSALANTYASENNSVCFIRVPLLISNIRDHMGDEQYRRELLWDLKNCDVLFLDDMGSEAATPWVRDSILFPILDERMNMKRKTYFSSNQTMQELKNRYVFGNEYNSEVAADRLLDRIRTLACPVLLKGTSRRKAPVLS